MFTLSVESAKLVVDHARVHLEKPDGWIHLQLEEVSGGRCRYFEWGYFDASLPTRSESGPRRRHDMDPFAVSHECLSEGPDLFKLVLTVVQYQEQTCRTKDPEQGVESGLVPGGNAVELGEHEFCRAPIARNHRQIDETNPILERPSHRACDSSGQTRLPYPPGTNEGDQAGRSHLVDESSDQPVPPDESRHLGRHVAVFSLDEREGRKPGGLTVRLQPEHLLGLAQTLQSQYPQILQSRSGREAVSHQVGRHPRHDGLTSVGRRDQPGNSIHGGSEVITGSFDALARVQCDSHPNLALPGPWFVPDHMLHRSGCQHGIRRGSERGAEGIADCLEDVTGMVADRLADEVVVTAKGFAHGRGMLLPQSGRPLDVGEQQGDDASGNSRLRRDQRDRSQSHLRLRGLPFEVWALLEDRLFEGCETWRGDKPDLREFSPKSLIGPNGLGLPSASVERQHQTFAQALVQRLFEHSSVG